MRHFSFRPSFTVGGRRNRGLRGLAGKPFHPPLTDVPITAYLFVAVFDVLSALLHSGHPVVAHQLYVVGLWLMLGAVVVSALAALTGWADWHKSSEPGTQARRTINAHAITMITVTVLAIVDLVLRGTAYADRESTPIVVLVLSVVLAVAVCVGATLGGSLVFDYGFNVETGGDHPVWHHSEIDVLPGHKPATTASTASTAPAADAQPISEQA
ncbi:MAG: DUF2231 domain-containing protein [Acidothermaceae bacterium]